MINFLKKILGISDLEYKVRLLQEKIIGEINTKYEKGKSKNKKSN